ncbi:MAG TPA: ABATE domain-containing protein [Thermomicrobiales bacterium]|jgi:predicted RNA-binding Zn ribbon-like protein
MSTPIATPGYAGQVALLAGTRCLDFANTVEPRVPPRHGVQPREYLTTYADLLDWAAHAELLTAARAAQLRHLAEANQAAAATALREAIGLREAIYRVFLAVAQRRPPDRADLDHLAHAYARALTHTTLIARAASFELSWVDDPDALDRPLWPLAHSAIELLTRGDAARVKECPTAEEGCGWLFYDTSKNRSRRWCSMSDCGTNAKERRRAARAER